MIVDSPVITRLAVGAGRIVPEMGDSQLAIPGLVFPVIDLLLPTSSIPAINVGMQESFIAQSIFNRSNQALTSQTICTLAKGYWRLNFVFNFRTNATFTPILNDVNNFVSINDGVSIYNLLLGYAAINQNISNQVLAFDVLLSQDSSLLHGVSATGATGTIESYVNVIGSRRL